MDLTVMTKEQLDEILVELKAGKAQLEASKKSAGKSWTKENQDKLQECISTIVDVEEQLEVLSSKEKAQEDKNTVKEGYQPLKGEEKLVVAKSLKTESISLDVIAKCTGLSIPEIERL